MGHSLISWRQIFVVLAETLAGLLDVDLIKNANAASPRTKSKSNVEN